MRKGMQNIITEDRVIYAFLSPTEKQFLVGHCLKESLAEIYRHNLKGRRDASREFINAISPERPCLIILETLACSIPHATNLLAVWIRILTENGFKCFNRSVLIDMAQNLNSITEALYKTRMNTDIYKLICCVNCSMPVYNKQYCERFPNIPSAKDT